MFSSPACCQGYQGLVDGGDHIRPATWESVSMMLQLVRAIMRILLTHQHFFSLFLMCNQDGSLVMFFHTLNLVLCPKFRVAP